ncbi:hypothetical protein A9Q94_06505 [Rhodobacterales bacterium 56_14_T64]|nr:hypothetical protein A9Q94_06505 [Rhodobacterales bacterium 56_14_T64]
MNNQTPETRTSLLGSIILSAGLGYAAHYFWPGIYTEDWQRIVVGVLVFLSAQQGLKAFSAFWRYRQDLLRLLRAYGEDTSHGSAEWMTERQARKSGLHKRTEGSRFVGVVGSTAIWLYTETHSLILGPAGSAKSSAGFMNWLSDSDESCIVVDTKREFQETTAEMRRDKFGHRIIILDPVSQATDFLNPLDHISEFFEQNSPAALSLVRGLALQLYPEPPQEGANLFFRSGTRMQMVTLITAVVAVCPPEQRNLTTVYRALTNEAFLNELLIQTARVSQLNGEVAQMAEDQHRMAFGEDGSEKTYEQFRIGAMQALEAFGPGNYLAHITSKSSFSFADLKRERTSVYLTVDFANKDVLGKWAGLMLWLATDQLVRANNNTPVVIYHDECCNSPLYNLPTVLTLLRSYGVKYVAATQDLDDFVRVYGKHAHETIMSETDIKQFLGGIRSQTTLEFLSKYLGDFTVNSASFAFSDDGIKESFSRSKRALLTTDELRRLRTDCQIVISGNHRPILARKVQVFAVEPWRNQIAPNRMYGSKRHLKPIEVIADLKRPKVTRRGKFKMPKQRIWPLVAEHVISRLPIAVFLLTASLGLAAYTFGLPHLRWQYRYVGPYDSPRYMLDCQYIGPEFFVHGGPVCPVIVLRKTW